ncbi:MAG: efflux RND transporter periplasmic adaptor subunit [Chthoniobacterales bacterium]
MNWQRWLWQIGALLGVLGVGFWLGQCSGGSSAKQGSGADSGPPVARVTLAPLEQKTISAKVTAYGSVITQPGKNNAVSVPYETRVRHVLVAPGESVTAGQALVAIDPSPQTKLQLAEARQAVQAAQKELNQVQQKFNLKLATNQELAVGKKNAENAQLQLQTLQQQGAASEQTVKAGMAGLVGNVNVQDGQIVPTGSPLVDLVARNEIEVKLGVEPEDALHVQTGQAVTLYQVHLINAKPIAGQVRLITQRIDPNTRLIDVYVSLPNESSLLLDSYFRAELQTKAHEALVVPRSAVLPEGDKHILYTVQNQHAVRHEVQVGLENTSEIEVIAQDLRAGQSVVVKGNYELSDGMAVATGKKS